MESFSTLRYVSINWLTPCANRVQQGKQQQLSTLPCCTRLVRIMHIVFPRVFPHCFPKIFALLFLGFIFSRASKVVNTLKWPYITMTATLSARATPATLPLLPYSLPRLTPPATTKCRPNKVMKNKCCWKQWMREIVDLRGKGSQRERGGVRGYRRRVGAGMA